MQKLYRCVEKPEGPLPMTPEVDLIKHTTIVIYKSDKKIFYIPTIEL